MSRTVSRLHLAVALCAALFACDDDDPTPTGPVEVPLSLAVDELDPIVLSVWGAADDDVWFAGGTLAPDGRYLAHFDGSTFAKVEAPEGGALWWVWGDDADHVWACGDRGGLVARRGGVWVAETTPLDETAVLWGLWGSGPGDLWAVGGSFRPSGPRGVVLRSTGDGTWTRLEDPALPDNANLFKVWGSGPDDVHIVGELGVALHYDGETLRRVDTDVTNLLFTVHGVPGGPVVAVGGLTEAAVLEWDGEVWQDTGVRGDAGLAGVFVRPGGAALAVGNGGAAWQRETDGTWTEAVFPELSLGSRTLHAVWGGSDTWVVGGDLQRQHRGLVATDRDPPPETQ